MSGAGDGRKGEGKWEREGVWEVVVRRQRDKGIKEEWREGRAVVVQGWPVLGASVPPSLPACPGAQPAGSLWQHMANCHEASDGMERSRTPAGAVIPPAVRIKGLVKC